MSYKQILYEKSEGIAWITLNRPEAMNALTLEMIIELREAVSLAGEDKDVRVIVVTGAGRAFCAGMDLKSLGDLQFVNGAIGDLYDLPSRALIDEIRNVPKPVIAMVNGACMTGGMEIALNFDIIIAAENAKFADTHARWGLRPSWGLSQRFPRIVGIMKAKEYSFTTKTFTAGEAEQMGIVNRVAPADKLKEEVKFIAEAILNNSAETIAAMKFLYNRGMNTTLEDGLELEYKTQFPINDTDERLKDFRK
ncbi:MAG: enoyl-CoA hydratase/isomerase family protein [Syntrophales bacterium]|nr:enoyl-CoA hydratase/isomerase family protein [Syntrophales bacterium]